MEKVNNITGAIDEYVENDKPTERLASFDYCYNYFYSFYKTEKISEIASPSNLQMSCLQLGFYLASWGMYRGSAPILQESAKSLCNTIREIANQEAVIWEIDVDSYTDENINLLLRCFAKIKESFKGAWIPSETLITKILLGVFSNVPAYDTRFKAGMRINSFSKKSLKFINNFYNENKIVFDSYCRFTYDFGTGEKTTDVIYKKAKLIDMYGVIMGGRKLDRI